MQLITAESMASEQGSSLVLGRLADVLLVHAFRRQAAIAKAQGAGLQALADPHIGAALGLMHGRLSEPWTVERLAAAVGMSRSGFAARFHALVGTAGTRKWDVAVRPDSRRGPPPLPPSPGPRRPAEFPSWRMLMARYGHTTSVPPSGKVLGGGGFGVGGALASAPREPVLGCFLRNGAPPLTPLAPCRHR